MYEKENRKRNFHLIRQRLHTNDVPLVWPRPRVEAISFLSARGASCTGPSCLNPAVPVDLAPPPPPPSAT